MSRVRSVPVGLLALAALAVLGACVTVYAAVGGGTGGSSGHARAGTALPLTIRGDASGLLRPGSAPAPIAVTVTNASDADVVLTSLTTAVKAADLPAGCKGDWFTVAQADVSPKSTLRVPANTTVTLAAARAPSIQLVESGTDQDACAQAKLTLTYDGQSEVATTAPTTQAPKTPRLTWANPSDLVYGARLTTAQLRARSSADGQFTYDPPAGTLLGAGRHTLTATFSPQNGDAYKRATVTAELTVLKARPAITWGTPAPLTYGDALSAAQLNATSPVAGRFSYTPASGARLNAGTQPLRATFTPDSDNYEPADATVSVSVAQARPVLTWNAPSDVTYPAALGAAQLNATASVPGTFTYDPPRASTPKAGTQTLSASFTPSDATNYAAATATVALTVAKGTPEITWTAPAGLHAGDTLGPAQLDATASVPGSFTYDPPAGTAVHAGANALSATFTPDDAGDYAPGKAQVTAQAVPAPAPQDAGNLLLVAIDGKPGIKVKDGHVRIAGTGLKPASPVTIVVHSTPRTLGSTTADANGKTSANVALPPGLGSGGHHIEVSAVAASGAPVIKVLDFSIATGDRLGSIGSIPKGPFAELVAFVPAEHVKTILSVTVGGTALLGALGAGIGNGGGRKPARTPRANEAAAARRRREGRGSGGRGGPGGRGGGAGGTDGAFLADVELEREMMARDGRGRGDRSRTWWWRTTPHSDHFSVHWPARLAALSPAIGRVSIDADYLRAMFGGLTVFLYPLALILGVAAAFNVHGAAMPPAFWWFAGILTLSIFDSMAGYVAGLSFAAAILLAGGVTSATNVRELAGIVLAWFSVPLAAGAMRPLRRHLRLRLDGLWDRAADFVMAGLFAGWLTAQMVELLNPLGGFELPLSEQKWTMALITIAVVGVRIVLESISTHLYPDRLLRLRHQGDIEESSTVQMVISFVIQISTFIFIAAAYMQWDWPLIAGAALFYTPLVPWLFVDKLPKSAFVAKYTPAGLTKWTFVLVAGVLLAGLLEHASSDPVTVENLGFVLLPLPMLIIWGLELFAADDDDEDPDEEPDEDEHEDVVEEGRFPMTWPRRLLGVPALAACVYLVMAGLAA